LGDRALISADRRFVIAAARNRHFFRKVNNPVIKLGLEI